MPLIGIGFILLPTSIFLFISQNQSALAYLLLYIIITLLRFFIEPKLVSKQLNISLLYYLFMMYICAKAFGFLGFFYAPLFCVFSLLWYNKNKTSHDSLGEQT